MFFAGTFFVFIYSQTNYSNPAFRRTFELIITTFSIIRNLLFSIAFLIKPEKEKKILYPKL